MRRQIRVIAVSDESALSHDDIRMLISLRGRASALRTLLRASDTLPSRDLVKFGYLTVLGREPDQEGLDIYSLFLRVGMNFIEFLNILSSSDEFRGSPIGDDIQLMADEEYLAIVYKRYLNREVDPSGREHYIGQLGRGVSKSKVAQAISKSKEARLISKQRRLIYRIIRMARWKSVLELPRNHEFILRIETEILDQLPLKRADSKSMSSYSIFNNIHNLQKLPTRARNIILNTALGLES